MTRGDHIQIHEYTWHSKKAKESKSFHQDLLCKPNVNQNCDFMKYRLKWRDLEISSSNDCTPEYTKILASLVVSCSLSLHLMSHHLLQWIENHIQDHGHQRCSRAVRFYSLSSNQANICARLPQLSPLLPPSPLVKLPNTKGNRMKTGCSNILIFKETNTKEDWMFSLPVLNGKEQTGITRKSHYILLLSNSLDSLDNEISRTIRVWFY